MIAKNIIIITKDKFKEALKDAFYMGEGGEFNCLTETEQERLLKEALENE